MLYLLHGENEVLREEALNEVIAASGLAPDLRAVNTEVLDETASAGDLRRACSAIPFLGDVRVVIASGLLSKAHEQSGQEIADYLSDVPTTTELVFLEEGTVSPKHPVLARAREAGLKVMHFPMPHVRNLANWIRERATKYGGTIEAPAAQVLAQNIGSHLRLLDQEIQKLLLYVGDRGVITAEDVSVMVPYVQSADVIFQMVDAVGQRNPRSASICLHRLLDVGDNPLGIFGMIVRQFRLLIQVQWLIEQHYPQSQIASRLKLHPYVASKIQTQANRFTPTQLREAYHLLAETDLAVKQGDVPIETALDLLVAQLTQL
ncbi:MAG: DNA polymerase III subunit delta [Chloroflexi bacterium]|nr:DNA polymerase III subunit delta [Chloroflexota bacterium]